MLLDAAHNADGAQALAAYLRRWHPERPPLVIGVMRDKDVDEHPRGAAAGDVDVDRHAGADAARDAGGRARAARRATLQPAGARPVGHADGRPDAADRAALERADTVCVAGSIFLAGAVRDGLKRRAILR